MKNADEYAMKELQLETTTTNNAKEVDDFWWKKIEYLMLTHSLTRKS